MFDLRAGLLSQQHRQRISQAATQRKKYPLDESELVWTVTRIPENGDWPPILHRDVPDNDRLWPWPSLDGMLLNGGILVDARGQRFTDEGRGGIHIANALGWSDDPAGAWVIANSTVWGKCQALVSTDPVPRNPERAGTARQDHHDLGGRPRSRRQDRR